MNHFFRIAFVLTLFCFIVSPLNAAEEESGLSTAIAFLESHATLSELPERPTHFDQIEARISGTPDPESKFGYIVFSIARHGGKLLTETQQRQLDELIADRQAAAINWHDVRNMVRVKAQIAMWDYASEADPKRAAEKKTLWNEWTDLRIAYMEQEFVDKERFQRAAWNLLTNEQRDLLRSGKWDDYLKKSTGHKRLFSADKQLSRVLGKPDLADAFSKAEAKWRERWDVMWAAYQAESVFERKREFSMDLADEAFALHSRREQYAPAFRSFAEHECEAIRELLQSGYALDEKALAKLKTYRNQLGRDASQKYSKAPETLRGLFSAYLTKQPNFIVIMVDDMGYAGLSCFGNPHIKTPELDRLAAEGIRFTDFHSSGTVCSPTRAGLLTGRYQQRAGIEAVIHPVSDHPEHRKGLQLSETTFAELLKEAGYSTGLIGKWHQGYPQNSDDFHPQNHGFDEFVGYHSGNIDFISHVGDHYAHDWWHGKQETPEEGYSTHLINQYAADFVERHGGSDEPFCLYIAHEAIHNPLQKPGDPVRRTVDEWKRWDWKNASKEEWIDMYRGMTLPVDEGVGQIRKILEEKGIAEDTMIIFFSDNGGASELPSNSPRWRAGKGSVYEGGHRVPALAWWPGRIQEGQVNDSTLFSLDVMPTMLSLAGIDPADYELDGTDLSPLLLESGPLPDRPLFWASMGNRGQRAEAMREGPWKLVVLHPKAKPGTFENEKVELYHLGNDPGETTDLAAKEPARTARMLSELKAWYEETQDGATPQPGGWLEAGN